MLRIFKAPESFSFGLEDRFSAKMRHALTSCGVPCAIADIWPDFWARNLYFTRLPYADRPFRHLIAPMACRKHLSNIEPEDVVWLAGTSLPIPDTECWFEKKVLERGASYVFWLEDDWFSNESTRTSAEVRVALADLIVAVTPTLTERISGLFPTKRVLLLEEAIDVERLAPRTSVRQSSQPVVLWTGRPWNLKKLLALNTVLASVYKDIPFTLRVVTGRSRPEVKFSVPWEWLPYDPSREAEYAAGAVAGIAPLENSVYETCKGNYKVKTYMALGVPPLTSPVGYNYHLIRHGENGFLLDSGQEWEAAIRQLLTDSSFTSKIGAAARETIINRYSYDALMPIYADTLQKAFPGKALVGG